MHRRIEKGIVVLLAVANDDEESDLDYVFNKVINVRIFEDKAELVFKEASLDPCVQQKHQQIQECLLIVEIQFVFECLFHRRHMLT